MNRKLKRELQQVFMAPKPVKKEIFLKSLNYPKTTWKQFILSQASYIKMRTWLISVALMALILYIVSDRFQLNIKSESNLEVIMICAALMPPLVLNAMTEIVRSRQYGMEELEMTTRYSFSHVMLVRMGWMGVSNFVVVMCVTIMLAQKTGLFFCRIALYMLIPYLITIFVSLWIMNHKPSKDSIYPCGVASIAVSGMIFVLGNTYKSWYRERNLYLWIIFLVVFTLLSMNEIRKTIKKSEDFKCNYGEIRGF